MVKTANKRPDMRAYFRAQIDRHVHGGGLSNSRPTLPRDVTRVSGTVTDSVITVTMRDGSVWCWNGGKYAARKVNGCYAPLMPTPGSTNA